MKVCVHCFKDEEICSFISASSTTLGKCNYCQSIDDSDIIEVSELLDFFNELISIYKPMDEGEPLSKLIQSGWGLFSDTVQINPLLKDILTELNNPISSPEQSVKYVDEITECVDYWEVLKNDLKWERRFISDIEWLKELGWDTLFSPKLELNPNDNLYRARIHQDEETEPFPENKMGCPSKHITSEGRANPRGIPYLYLSKETNTTLYETRASYLDEVSIGSFKPKNVQIINLVDFTDTPSAFLYIGEIKEHTKSMLLKRLISIDLSKPIRRYDSSLDYIPTQFICEFIRHVTNADGILFESSLQKGGQNIVLFDEKQVECISVTKHRISEIFINSDSI